MWTPIIKVYFALGYYTKDDVKVFVAAGYITAADYKNITGEDYTP